MVPDNVAQDTAAPLSAEPEPTRENRTLNVPANGPIITQAPLRTPAGNGTDRHTWAPSVRSMGTGTSTPSVMSAPSRKASSGVPTPRIRPSLNLVQTTQPDKGPLALNKFILYENRTRFYIVASNTSDSRHRILKIDRTSDKELVVHEDETIYSGKQMMSVLKMLEDGNKSSGGLGKARVFFGIAGEQQYRDEITHEMILCASPGFIRFTAGWYMIVISKRSVVALLGGHYLYHCEATDIIPVCFNQKLERPSEEARSAFLFFISMI